MKKLTITLLVAVFACMTAMAGSNPLRLMSGSLSPLKGKGGRISVVMDFSKTKANRKPFEQYLVEDFGSDMETFERYKPEMYKWFCDRWDDDIEEGPKVTRSDDAPMEVKIIVKTMQLGSKSGFGGSSISGYAEFYKKGETEPFAKVEILKMNGTQFGGAMFGFPGLKQVFNDLAEHLCDLIYHN